MTYTQEQFEQLTRADRELNKFCLDNFGNIALRVKNSQIATRDASTWDLPTTTAGITNWRVISVAWTLPAPVWSVNPWDFIIYDGTTWTVIKATGTATAQVNSDRNATSWVAEILNKPDIASLVRDKSVPFSTFYAENNVASLTWTTYVFLKWETDLMMNDLFIIDSWTYTNCDKLKFIWDKAHLDPSAGINGSWIVALTWAWFGNQLPAIDWVAMITQDTIWNTDDWIMQWYMKDSFIIAADASFGWTWNPSIIQTAEQAWIYVENTNINSSFDVPFLENQSSEDVYVFDLWRMQIYEDTFQTWLAGDWALVFFIYNTDANIDDQTNYTGWSVEKWLKNYSELLNYNNDDSTLVSNNVKEAIDELDNKVENFVVPTVKLEWDNSSATESDLSDFIMAHYTEISTAKAPVDVYMIDWNDNNQWICNNVNGTELLEKINLICEKCIWTRWIIKITGHIGSFFNDLDWVEIISNSNNAVPITFSWWWERNFTNAWFRCIWTAPMFYAFQDDVKLHWNFDFINDVGPILELVWTYTWNIEIITEWTIEDDTIKWWHLESKLTLTAWGTEANISIKHAVYLWIVSKDRLPQYNNIKRNILEIHKDITLNWTHDIIEANDTAGHWIIITLPIDLRCDTEYTIKNIHWWAISTITCISLIDNIGYTIELHPNDCITLYWSLGLTTRRIKSRHRATLTGVISPLWAKTPRVIWDIYKNTDNSAMYISTGLTDVDWMEISLVTP